MSEKKKKRKTKAAPKTFIDQAAVPMAIAGGIAILLALVWWSVQDKFGVTSIILCILGTALMGVAIASKPAEVKATIVSRQMMMGTKGSVNILAVLGILVFINYIGVRHHKRFDLTKMKQHTLSEQTVNILRGLKDPLEITAFYNPSRGGARDFEQMKELLDEYKAQSRKVKSQVVNALLEPDKAQAMNVTQVGTTVIMCGTKRETVTFANEQSLTSAILKVTQDKKRKVYFLTGHGEHAIDDSDQVKGYSDTKSALEKLNYIVESLSLIRQNPTIPNDCDVLVIAGPKTPLMPQEEKLVNQYLDAHGHALIMLDPDSPPFTGVLKKWGVEADPGIVVEPIAQLFYGAAAPVVQQYESHIITNPLRGMTSVFLIARPLKAEATPPPGQPGAPSSPNQVTPLAKTTPDSFAALKTEGNKIKHDPEHDKRGPFVLAAAVTSGSPPPPQYPGAPPPPPDTGPKTRLVVVGDSDFAGNQLIDNASLGNGNLFTNMINWLSEEENLVSIQPKEPYVTSVNLTKESIRKVFFLSTIVLPFCVLLGGGYVWWKRR